MKYALLYSSIILIILLKVTISPLCDKGSTELGSKKHPIMLMLTPSVEAHKITSSAEALVSYLSAATGYQFTHSIPTSFNIVVESFGSGVADIAITNTFSYVQAHAKYGAEAALMVVRRDGETSYRGQIIARKDSGIDSLYQLQGKKFAYVDAASTSGYVLPKALFEKNSVTFSETVFGSKHDNVVNMVYQQQVDAGATYYSPPDKKTGEILDARARVKTQYPDIYEKVKIVALTDAIPNDPLIFRKDFPAEMRTKIINALIAFQKTPEGRKVLFETYSVEGFAPTTDNAYDTLRELVQKYVYSNPNK